MLRSNILKRFLIIAFLAVSMINLAHGFSECPNCGLSDPSISGVTDCPSWLAYLQSTGQDVVAWCANSANYQKCCLTCRNIQNMNNCTDIAYGPDCQAKAAAGMCSYSLSSQTVKAYCPKSCGLCSSSLGNTMLSCTSLSYGCNTGTCTQVTLFSINTIRCTCPSGYSGAYCQRADPCLSGVCLNGGVCTSQNDEDTTYTCACTSGCSGKNCASCSACNSLNCLNGGTCSTNSFGQSYCQCPSNYAGSYCQIFVGSCNNSPCLNGGTCVTTSTGYTCTCPYGFSGINCQIGNACYPNLCQNGATCIATGTSSYSCSCTTGYYGTLCQNPVVACNSNPCLNNGLCNPNSDGTYTCVCLPGFSGTYCQISGNPCSSAPCQNGGTCQVVGTSSFVCICASLYLGAYCQTSNPCSNFQCYNGGSCTLTSSGTASCACPPGYSGSYCQTPQSSQCSNNPCLNGGVCVPQSGLSNGNAYYCQCQANYYGLNCNYQVTAQTCSGGDQNTAYCSVWAAFGFCAFTYSYNLVPVPIYCPQSCGLCKSVSACTDTQTNCAIWAQLGLCSLVNARDANLCKKSCGTCAPNVSKK